MLQDPNIERVIKNYTEPLQKQISMMQIELEALKKQCNIGAVKNWRFLDDPVNNRLIGFVIGLITGVLLYACF